MHYEEFKNYIKDNIRGCLPSEFADHEVKITKQQKNNNTVLDAVLIRGKETVVPVIYLEPFYRMHQEGTGTEEVLGEIARVYMNGLQQRHPSVVENFRFEDIKEKLFVTVINAEMNEEILTDVPHEIREDLALVYRVYVDMPGDINGSILVHNAHLLSWEITEEMLKEAAWENMCDQFKPEFISMDNLLEGLLGMNQPFDESVGTEMYVLTNREKFHGAAYIFDEQLMGRIAEELGADLLILPSSIHEAIILKMTEDIDVEAMRNMVMEINYTQLAPNEILSNEIYQFCRESNTISMITEGEQKQGMSMGM